MKFAYANRAFARIRKYEFSNSRSLLKNSEITVMATKEKIEIPFQEKERICADIKQALFLGDKAAMVYEAQSKYCK
jgi:hypothetical protein